ncbi:hypothetical protein [Azospirillum griseum]|uniref:hypothetical protein n=1 Tax=Azospirillum griseum TaxID=2496639 RepID=UPI00131512C2|nr:hypothetical protein [Azospirillum griseum]
MNDEAGKAATPSTVGDGNHRHRRWFAIPMGIQCVAMEIQGMAMQGGGIADGDV